MAGVTIVDGSFLCSVRPLDFGEVAAFITLEIVATTCGASASVFHLLATALRAVTVAHLVNVGGLISCGRCAAFFVAVERHKRGFPLLCGGCRFICVSLDAGLSPRNELGANSFNCLCIKPRRAVVAP